MKTIRYEIIDGKFIYTGFDIMPADPEATRVNSEILFQSTEICGRMRAKDMEKKAHIQAEASAIKQANALHAAALKEKDPAKVAVYKRDQAKQQQIAKDHAGAANVCNAELAAMIPEATAVMQQIRSENIVYAPGPRKNEALGNEQDVYAVIMSALQCSENEKLEIDLVLENEIVIEAEDPTGTGQRQEVRQYRLNSATTSKIADFRGSWWFKDAQYGWQESVIEILGVTPTAGEIKKENLTPEQSEEIRMQNLTPDAKAEEKEAAIDSAAAQAANMRSKLEIQNAPDALQQARDWYDGRAAEINAKYI